MLSILTVFWEVHQRPLPTGSMRVTGPIMLPTATHFGSLMFHTPPGQLRWKMSNNNGKNKQTVRSNTKLCDNYLVSVDKSIRLHWRAKRKRNYPCTYSIVNQWNIEHFISTRTKRTRWKFRNASVSNLRKNTKLTRGTKQLRLAVFVYDSFLIGCFHHSGKCGCNRPLFPAT